MDRTRAVGVVVTLASLAGYAAGAVAPYPGRAVTLAGVMVGVTLAAVGGGSRRDGDWRDPGGGKRR
jgi:hypothetical protein